MDSDGEKHTRTALPRSQLRMSSAPGNIFIQHPRVPASTLHAGQDGNTGAVQGVCREAPGRKPLLSPTGRTAQADRTPWGRRVDGTLGRVRGGSRGTSTVRGRLSRSDLGWKGPGTPETSLCHPNEVHGEFHRSCPCRFDLQADRLTVRQVALGPRLIHSSEAPCSLRDLASEEWTQQGPQGQQEAGRGAASATSE